MIVNNKKTFSNQNQVINWSIVSAEIYTIFFPIQINSRFA